MTNRFITILIFSWFLGGCSSSNEQKHNNNKSKEEQAKLKEHLMNANKIFNANQLDDIDDYVQRHQFRIDTTATGLRIKINKTGSGPLPDKSNTVTINYSVTLLDGAECYNSDSSGAWKFSLSHDDVPKGLHETVSMMKVGDKALAILPSYLAYGITGDGNKIPPHAALIYQIELLKIE